MSRSMSIIKNIYHYSFYSVPMFITLHDCKQYDTSPFYSATFSYWGYLVFR